MIVIKRIGVTILLSAILGAVGASASIASDTPSLLWERGRQQTITLGGSSEEAQWKIRLVGASRSLKFVQSSPNNQGYYVFTVDIPKNFPLGDYKVLATSESRPESLVADVTVSPLFTYDLMADPNALGGLATIFFTLAALLSMNALNSRNEDEQSEENQDDKNQDDNSGTVESIGTDRLAFDQGARGSFDRLHLAKFPLIAMTDAIRHTWIHQLAPRSRAWMRIVADASWLQALLGPVAFITPVLGAALGGLMFLSQDFANSVIPSPSVYFITLFIVGIFDALAGAMGGITYLLCVLATGHLSSASDLRGLMGLAVIFFLPVIIAGGTRPLRRDRKNQSGWERLTDYLVAPTFSYWAIKGLVGAIDGFVKSETELSAADQKIALIAALCLVARLIIEDVVGVVAPARIEYLSAPYVRSQDTYYAVISLVVKVAIFLFFMYGFLQYSWQGLVAVGFLTIPQIIKLIQDRLPNYPILFQLIPGGVPGVVFMGLLGIAMSNWVNSLPLVAEDKSKTILVLLGIPGFVLTLLKLIGREAKPGDVRWYRRPQNKGLYRVGGVLFLILALSLTSGVIS